jgi:hypothetical protein
MPFFHTLTGMLLMLSASVLFNPYTILVILVADAKVNSNDLDSGGQSDPGAGGPPTSDSLILSTILT